MTATLVAVIALHAKGRILRWGDRLLISSRPVYAGAGGHSVYIPARTVESRPVAPTRPENDEAAPPGEDEAAGRTRAACRNRTDDLLITSEMLYRLS